MIIPQHPSRFAAIMLLAASIFIPRAEAQEDQGTSVIGKLEVTVYLRHGRRS